MKTIAYIALKVIAILLVAIGAMFLFGAFFSYLRNSDLNSSSIIMLTISIIFIASGLKISKFAVTKNNGAGINSTEQENLKPIKFNDIDSGHQINGEVISNSKILKKTEIVKKAIEMLSSGKSKSEVFESLSSGGKTDGYLANIIASHPDDFLCSYYAKKINTAINIMFFQAFMGFIYVFNNIEVKLSFTGKLALASFCAAVSLLFAWGFYKNKAGFYNAYIILTLTQLPRALQGFQAQPLVLVGFVLNLLMLVYIWHVRNKLFPDFVFIMPKKVKGKYVFSS